MSDFKLVCSAEIDSGGNALHATDEDFIGFLHAGGFDVHRTGALIGVVEFADVGFHGDVILG